MAAASADAKVVSPAAGAAAAAGIAAAGAGSDAAGALHWSGLTAAELAAAEARAARNAADPRPIMLWSVRDARLRQVDQSRMGASSCAPAAILSALRVMRVPGVDERTACDKDNGGFKFQTRCCPCFGYSCLPACKVGVAERLLSRSRAGMTAHRLDRATQRVTPDFLATLSRVTPKEPVSCFYISGADMKAHPLGVKGLLRAWLHAGAGISVSQNCQLCDTLPVEALSLPPGFAVSPDAVCGAPVAAGVGAGPQAADGKVAAAAAADAKGSAAAAAVGAAEPPYPLVLMRDSDEGVVKDWWHAQCVFGISNRCVADSSGQPRKAGADVVYLTNALQRLDLDALTRFIDTPSAMLVRAVEALHHARDLTDDQLRAVQWPTPEWGGGNFRVTEQLLAARALRRRCRMWELAADADDFAPAALAADLRALKLSAADERDFELMRKALAKDKKSRAPVCCTTAYTPELKADGAAAAAAGPKLQRGDATVAATQLAAQTAAADAKRAADDVPHRFGADTDAAVEAESKAKAKAASAANGAAAAGAGDAVDAADPEACDWIHDPAPEFTGAYAMRVRADVPLSARLYRRAMIRIPYEGCTGATVFYRTRTTKWLPGMPPPLTTPLPVSTAAPTAGPAPAEAAAAAAAGAGAGAGAAK